MTAPSLQDAIDRSADELAAILRDETAALMAYEPPSVLDTITRAKRRMTDRLLDALETLRGSPTKDAGDVAAAQAALARVLPIIRTNEALVSRRLELVQDLIGAIELETRRAGGQFVSIYEADGRMPDQQPVPVSVDSVL